MKLIVCTKALSTYNTTLASCVFSSIAVVLSCQKSGGHEIGGVVTVPRDCIETLSGAHACVPNVVHVGSLAALPADLNGRYKHMLGRE